MRGSALRAIIIIIKENFNVVLKQTGGSAILSFQSRLKLAAVWPDWAILKLLGSKLSCKSNPNILRPFQVLLNQGFSSNKCCD